MMNAKNIIFQSIILYSLIKLIIKTTIKGATALIGLIVLISGITVIIAVTKKNKLKALLN